MLVTDSRKVKKGDTFLALRGVETDGHDYIVSAIENGAVLKKPTHDYLRLEHSLRRLALSFAEGSGEASC